MGEYGVHLTRYGEVSDGHLYSMFRESAYARLSESEKLDLLQELSGKYGTEASFEAYTKSMAATGYQAMEQKAILKKI